MGTDTELEDWLSRDYARAYRTACLILRNPRDAEEAVQEAFLRAWRFRASMPAGQGARPWLYRVVVNTCCSKLRPEIGHRTRRCSAEDLDALASSRPGPEEVAESTEVTAAVLRALAGLPEHLRIPVILRYYAGLSEREIATAIRRRPGTVKSRLHEARRRLADQTALRLLADQAAPSSGPGREANVEDAR